VRALTFATQSFLSIETRYACAKRLSSFILLVRNRVTVNIVNSRIVDIAVGNSETTVVPVTSILFIMGTRARLCGFADHADHVAALNIRGRAIVNWPDVSESFSLSQFDSSLGTSPSPSGVGS